MHFKYRGMDIFHDWLEITYRMSNTTFDINCAKEICSAFAEGEAVLSCITTSYEEDLSDTSSFFDSYTRHCSIRNIEDLNKETWDGTFLAEYHRPDCDPREKPVLSLSSRKYSSDISVLYDISQNDLYFVPEPVDDRELSLEELVRAVTGKPDSEERRDFVKAVALAKNKWYDDAYRLLHKIGRDREAATLLPRGYLSHLALQKGIMLREKGQYEEALASFSKAADLKQTEAEVQETVYRLALQELNRRNDHKAFDLLVEIIEYKDARQLLQRPPLSNVNSENMRKQWQTVLFGHNGELPIPWIVMEVQKGQALLLSKYPLWSGPFHNTHEPVAWEKSSLCKALNTVFKQEAFSTEDLSRILPNEDLFNRIFLLNSQRKEVIDSIPFPCVKKDPLLFQSLDNRQHRLSPIDSWWLKDTQASQPNACRVLELKKERRILDGGVMHSYWVRPAIWVRMEKKRSFFGF